MPNKKSAKKELRKGLKRQVYNANLKHQLKDLTKKADKAIATNSKEAKEILAATIKALDKAAQKGIIKKNTGSRKKSRLQLRLNKQTKK
ncbi:MAG: 30S ribosomal protein S20 [Candidatus Falkowbacteria bacterium GW2011_GWA2_39_24]|uniref:Small ribosomal subunit protein bS20 n=1 Tax=Candidatus Falkowbacteria bacterium GW2011_GWA2_39_24 TaxID=1618634 RepID=A0A0G0NG52_9BACT|nr:MAG: 30S ribosomal protein S20 [Candidatus Falkowbacteria bacterium GW2011_GWA2_39_24]